MGTHLDINDIAGRQEITSKPVHTVINGAHLWQAMLSLASAVLTQNPTILNFNREQTQRQEKGPMNLRGITANIAANGWVVRYGNVTVAPLNSITIEQLQLTVHLLPDRSFQFTVGLLHWTQGGCPRINPN